MEEIAFTPGSVPVVVVARVYPFYSNVASEGVKLFDAA